MILSDLSVKRPVFAIVLSLLLVVFGLVAFEALPLRQYPDIDPPVVSVETAYPGASAQIVETKVTKILEDEVSGIEGIRTITSQSRDGRSIITIEFKISRDVDAAANDVRDRVSRASDTLPKEADPPIVSKADADARPIMWLTLRSNVMDGLALADYADRYLKDRLAALEGVSKIRGGGNQRYAMRVWIDRKALAARNLTVNDIESALRRENMEAAAGRLESRERDFSLRTARGYRTAEDFRRLVLARGADGYLVRLGEVAEVKVDAQDIRRYFRINSMPATGLGIVKQSQANTLAVARAVREEVARMQPGLPEGVVLEVAYDSSIFIDASIREVVKTLAIAAGLVVLVIYIFLGDLRATLVPAVTVPVSIIATFIVLDALGFSMNILTLLALVLAIGLVVDDAIVVLENIHRRIDEGEPALLAAYRGARQVGFAVIATTLVLVAVFVPISFIPGNTGRLFAEFAIALASAVLFSSIVALSLTPMMCSKLFSRQRRQSRLARWVTSGFDRLAHGYERALRWSLNHSAMIIVLVITTFGAIAGLLKQVPSEFTPAEDRGDFMVLVTGPEGAGFDYMVRYMKQIEKILEGLRDSGEARFVLSWAPRDTGGAANSGINIIGLTRWEKRERDSHAIVGEMFSKLRELPGVNAFPVEPKGLGTRGFSQGVQLVIGGNTYEELARWRDIVVRRLQDYPGLLGVDSDFKQTKPQMRIVIDRDRAADLGVSVESIARTLETMFGSRRVTTYIERGEEYDVILQGRASDRRTPGDVSNIHVRSARSGALVPLSNLIRIEEGATAARLNRYDRLRAVTISANLAPGYTLAQAVEFFEQVVHDDLPETARIGYKGEARELTEASRSMVATFAMALLIVFLVLAAQFESFIHPLVIMITVPLALVAALAGLYVTGLTLNIFSQIGIVMLIGLAAKNGILIVEFTNQMRDAGLEFRVALVEASTKRLRPILMTGMSTVMGAVPLILASGAGAEDREVIGVVVFSGVLFATLLTLFVVPVFYDLLARHTRSPSAVARDIAELENKA